MSVYLVINTTDGIVTNAIEWDGGQSLSIPNSIIIPVPDNPEGVWIDWQLVDGEWKPPVTQHDMME